MECDKDRMESTISGFIDAISRDDAWPKIDELLRKAVRVVADEWQKEPGPDPGLKIDVKSLIKDLGSGSLNADLQQLFTWNHRFIALLAEKNRRAAVETYDFVDAEMPRAMFNP